MLLSKFGEVKIRLKESDWPTEWTGLRDGLRDRYVGVGGRPQFFEGQSSLMEMPMFGIERRRELEWVVVGVDLEYSKKN